MPVLGIPTRRAIPGGAPHQGAGARLKSGYRVLIAAALATACAPKPFRAPAGFAPRAAERPEIGLVLIVEGAVEEKAIGELYAAFEQPARKRWLSLDGLTPLTSRKDKSVRWKLSDGTRVEINFWKKGPAKSQAQLQHRLIGSKERAEELRAFWTERFQALGEHTLPG